MQLSLVTKFICCHHLGRFPLIRQIFIVLLEPKLQHSYCLSFVGQNVSCLCCGSPIPIHNASMKHFANGILAANLAIVALSVVSVGADMAFTNYSVFNLRGKWQWITAMNNGNETPPACNSRIAMALNKQSYLVPCLLGLTVTSSAACSMHLSPLWGERACILSDRKAGSSWPQQEFRAQYVSMETIAQGTKCPLIAVGLLRYRMPWMNTDFVFYWTVYSIHLQAIAKALAI